MHQKKTLRKHSSNHVNSYKELLLFKKKTKTKTLCSHSRYLVFHCCWRIQTQGSVVKDLPLIDNVLNSILSTKGGKSNFKPGDGPGELRCRELYSHLTRCLNSGHSRHSFQQMKTCPGEKQNIHLQISPLAVNTLLLEFNALIILHYLQPM